MKKHDYWTVETPITCKNYGGKWDKEHGVCVQFEDEIGGCLSPIKGLKLCWEGVDLYNDIDTVDSWKGKYFSDVSGTNWDGETILNSMEWGDIELLDSQEDAVKYGRQLALEIGYDIKRGRADYWCLNYKSPRGTISDKKVPHCTITDTDEECKLLKPFSFRRKQIGKKT